MEHNDIYRIGREFSKLDVIKALQRKQKLAEKVQSKLFGPASHLQESRSRSTAPTAEDMPSTNQAGNQPSSSQVENRPSSSQVGNRPSTSQVETRPSASQVENSPSTSQVENRPSASQVENSPSTSQVENRPSASQVENRPSASQVENRPSASQVGNVPRMRQVENVPRMRQVNISDLKRRLELDSSIMKALTTLTSVKFLTLSMKAANAPTDFEGPAGGSWREATLKCNIQSVLFRLHFYVRKTSKKQTYHDVTVTMLKKYQAMELKDSVLSEATTLAEVVYVLHRYSRAVDSRRETLRFLAEVYKSNLNIAYAKNGSVECRVLNLLKIYWRLENTSYILDPYRHRMTYDVRNMDMYGIVAISSWLNNLHNPRLGTPDRTALLSNIIHTTIESARAKRQDAE